MSGSAVDVVMPQLGESIVEGTIVRWAVAVGQTIRRGDLLSEVETDKATAEIPAPADGVVKTLLAQEGDTVPVGTVVARIATHASESSTHSGNTTHSDNTASEGNSLEASHSSAANEGIITPSAKPGRLPNRRLVEQLDGSPDGPRRTSPAVRRLARTHSVNLHALSGSGYRGRVTRDDVLAEVERRSSEEQPDLPPQLQGEVEELPTTIPGPSDRHAAPLPVVSQPVASPGFRAPPTRIGPRDRVEPLGRRRQRIAQNLKYSQQTAAHVATVAEIDMSAVFRAKKIDGAHCEADGVRLTVLSYVVQAVAMTLTEVPELNATVDDDNVI
ncbi:MAG: biotin/lipoyl-containing protein, partial [Myxococcota bacterium]